MSDDTVTVTIPIPERIDPAQLTQEAARERRRIIADAALQARLFGVTSSVLSTLTDSPLAVTREEWLAASERPGWVEGTVTEPALVDDDQDDDDQDDEQDDDECSHDDHYTCCGFCEGCDTHACEHCQEGVCDRGFCHECEHTCEDC
jgi:hypothetical protein